METTVTLVYERLHHFSLHFQTSIVFSLEEGPGVLFKALAVFSMREINLTKAKVNPIFWPWKLTSRRFPSWWLAAVPFVLRLRAAHWGRSRWGSPTPARMGPRSRSPDPHKSTIDFYNFFQDNYFYCSALAPGTLTISSTWTSKHPWRP